jgi:hypothetical protein
MNKTRCRFEFATDTFAIGAGVRYQTRLQGFEDGHWSEFYDYTGVDYTNLPEGVYVFEVRARDIDGRWAASRVFRFASSRRGIARRGRMRLMRYCWPA